jgi:hypothetical protein
MWRYAVLVVVSSTAIALMPVGAWAEPVTPDQATVDVGTISSGPVTSTGSAGFDRSGTRADASSRPNQPMAGASPGPVAVSGSSDVTYGAIPYNAVPCGNVGPPQQGTGGAIIKPPCIPASACPAGQTGFYAYDASGASIGVVCVGNQAAPAPGVAAPSPVQLAQQASTEQPWPVLQVAVNPGTGLTGLASWFWLGGNPAMPDATASAGPLTVTVHATLVDVTWDFGDGSSVSSGADLGRAFPAPSGIQHVYQTDTFGRPGGALVTALVRYRVTYSVNGGPFALLGLKARPYSAPYQVNQLQPQAVSVP